MSFFASTNRMGWSLPVQKASLESPWLQDLKVLNGQISSDLRGSKFLDGPLSEISGSISDQACQLHLSHLVVGVFLARTRHSEVAAFSLQQTALVHHVRARTAPKSEQNGSFSAKCAQPRLKHRGSKYFSTNCCMSSAQRGTSSLGFITTQFPAAMAVVKGRMVSCQGTFLTPVSCIRNGSSYKETVDARNGRLLQHEGARGSTLESAVFLRSH